MTTALIKEWMPCKFFFETESEEDTMSEKRLEEERKECNLTQEQVAEYLEISRSTLYRREANLTDLSEEKEKCMRELYRRVKAGEKFEDLLAEAKAKRERKEKLPPIYELLQKPTISLSKLDCEVKEREFSPALTADEIAATAIGAPIAAQKRKRFPAWKIALLVFLGIVALIAGLACYFLIGIIRDQLEPHDAMATTWGIPTYGLIFIFIGLCFLMLVCIATFVILIVKKRRK